MDTLGVVLLVIYGGGFAFGLARAVRDRGRAGVLNRPDGRALVLEEGGLRQARYRLRKQSILLMDGRHVRLVVEGLELAAVLGFRLQALTSSRSESLEARLVVDSNKKPALARRLFRNSEVRRALQELCGASATFRSVNLYPGGALVVDAQPGGTLDDLAERLLRFAEALDAAIPALNRDDDDDVDLGSAGGASGTPAAFSIEIRS